MTDAASPPLHQACRPLAALLGTWRGPGEGEYPTIESFAYLEEVVFGHVGKPFVSYVQRTRDATSGLPLHAESGYLRPIEGGSLEMVIAQPTGIVELHEGTVASATDTVEIRLATTMVTTTATARDVSAVERLLSIAGDELRYELSMAAVGQPLQHHLAATLRRDPVIRRGRRQRFMTRRLEAGALATGPDDVLVEEPMSIQLDGVLVSTTMRTPGDDFELAVGFCFTEGLLGGATPTGVRYCADGPASDTAYNVVTVETGGLAPTPTPRLGPATSSCGICGSESIEALVDRLEPLGGSPFDIDVLAAAPEAVGRGQELFAATGGAHAAAAIDRAGQVLITREDIGRHNAVDKVVGRLLLDGALPSGDAALFVSGRASYELVAKAWAAGFAALVAVSAPSALAVETARTAGLQLAGFARDGGLRLYAPAP